MEFELSKNAKVTDINTVPADYRPFYKQGEEGFVIDAENPVVKSAVSIIAGQFAALRSERGVSKTLRDTQPDLSALADYGATPAEIAEAFNKTLEKERNKAKQNDPNKIAEGIINEWKPKVDTEKRRGDALQGQLFSVLVTNEAASAFTNEKGAAEDFELVMPFIQKQVKVVEENGKLEVHVVDGSGNTRFGGTGARMTVRDLVKEMKSEARFGKFFQSETPNGGGANANRRSVPTVASVANSNRAQMSSKDKIAAGLRARGMT